MYLGTFSADGCRVTTAQPGGNNGGAQVAKDCTEVRTFLATAHAPPSKVREQCGFGKKKNSLCPTKRSLFPSRPFLIKHGLQSFFTLSSSSFLSHEEQSFIFTLAFAFFNGRSWRGNWRREEAIFISITYPLACCSFAAVGYRRNFRIDTFIHRCLSR